MIRKLGHRSSVQNPLHQEILPYIRSHVDHDAHIYLFGSRARGTQTVYSDRDIAIDGDPSLDRKKLARIKSYFDETPYKVDIIDLSIQTYFTDTVRSYMIAV